MAAAQAARTGGRTQQGKTPAPSQHAPGQFRGVRPPRRPKPTPAPTAGQQGTLFDDPRGEQASLPLGTPAAPKRASSPTSATRSTKAAPRRTSPTAAPASSPAQAPASSAPTAAPTTTRINTASREGSGALLMLFAYPMVFNLLRGGPAGLRAWLKAKFVNQPEQASQTGLAAGGRKKSGKR